MMASAFDFYQIPPKLLFFKQRAKVINLVLPQVGTKGS
jgi:hypothetical protein